MAWISLNNLTRFFKQMLVKNITWKGQHTFASNTTFSGGLSSSGTNLTGTTTVQGDFTAVDGIKVFARPAPNLQPVQIMTVDINGLKYKGNLVATKADITDNSITVDDALSDTSTNPVQNKVINSKFNRCIDYTDVLDEASESQFGSGWVPMVNQDGTYLWRCQIGTLFNSFAGQLDSTYAPKASPAFTGVVTATDVKVSTSLTIPGGKVWIE